MIPHLKAAIVNILETFVNVIFVKSHGTISLYYRARVPPARRAHGGASSAARTDEPPFQPNCLSEGQAGGRDNGT